jgi:pimeloyl-ACP methyl ester carboxylesterase
MSPYVVTNQTIGLMDKLEIASATIFGSSSGGIFAMALLQEHEKRVERIIVHEIPMTVFKNLKDWAAWPESENPKIVQICQGLFLDGMNEDKRYGLALVRTIINVWKRTLLCGSRIIVRVWIR